MGSQPDWCPASPDALCRASGLGVHCGRADVEASCAAQGFSRRGAGVIMAEIRVPTLGESVTEATIGKGFKKPGDAVAVDEPLVELETDKVTIEVPAPAAGVLGEISAKDGETVAVGAVLGQIKEGAGAPAKAPPPAVPKTTAEPAAPPAAAKPAAAPVAAAPKAASDAPLAPSVRKLSAESGVDADTV